MHCKFQPLECPKIVNGTIVEEDEEENKETEEEEEKELEEVTNDVAMGGYNQQRRLDRNQMSSRFDRQMPRQGYNDVVRGSRHQLENGVKRRRFDSKEEEEEEEDAEENKPKPIVNLRCSKSKALELIKLTNNIIMLVQALLSLCINVSLLLTK